MHGFNYMKNIQDNLDKNETIKMLRSALADEFIAMHNYWNQASVIQGVHKEEIQKELWQHRDEEQGHANMLIERILQLGGNPEIRPLDWDRLTGCRYIPALSWNQKSIIQDALNGENCAVEHYTRIAQFVQSKDDTTYDIIMKIMDDEYGHIKDLRRLQDMINGNKEKTN